MLWQLCKIACNKFFFWFIFQMVGLPIKMLNVWVFIIMHLLSFDRKYARPFVSFTHNYLYDKEKLQFYRFIKLHIYTYYLPIYKNYQNPWSEQLYDFYSYVVYHTCITYDLITNVCITYIKAQVYNNIG